MFIITILLLFLTASDILKPATNEKANLEKPKISFAQDTEKEGKGDTYSIALLKQMREKVDEWLKSLNEKIEREDITRFEVRFYEFLRNVLDWVNEKIASR